MKKKIIPLLLFIMAFSGFLTTQILWDQFHLNARQDDQEKQKYSVYEKEFQALKLTTVKGEKVSLSEEKSPIVVLNFWASWCLPCIKEFPSLVKFQEKYAGKVRVIGINGDEEDPEINVKKTTDKYKLNFDSTIDPKSTISNKFMISTYPVSMVFHKGKVIFVSSKIHDFMESSFTDLIDSKLAESR